MDKVFTNELLPRQKKKMSFWLMYKDFGKYNLEEKLILVIYLT